MSEVRNLIKNMNSNEQVKIFSGLLECILNTETKELQQFKISQLACFIYKLNPNLFDEILSDYRPSFEDQHQKIKTDSELSRASYLHICGLGNH